MLYIPSRSVSRGFTLVEVLVALAVIGILAVIAIPGISRSSGSHRVVEQTRRVHSDLVEARARAVAEQRRYRVQFFGGASWRVQFEASDGTWTQQGAARSLPDGFDLSVEGLTDNSVRYDSRGRVLDPKTVVIADEEGHDQRIEVGGSGMIQWFANE